MAEPQLLSTDALLLASACGVALVPLGLACLARHAAPSMSARALFSKLLAVHVTALALFALLGDAVLWGQSVAGLFGLPGWMSGAPAPGFASLLFQWLTAGAVATLVAAPFLHRWRWQALLSLGAMTGVVLFPLLGHWAWGGELFNARHGWLAQIGFVDLAGATVIFALVGTITLTCCWWLKENDADTTADEAAEQIDSESDESSTLVWLGGVLLLAGWLSMYSGLAMLAQADLTTMLTNTCLAATLGALVAIGMACWLWSEPVPKVIVRGTLAAVVSVAAAAHLFSPLAAICVGAVGSAVCVSALLLWQERRWDDALGTVPVYAFAGIWGALAVPLIGDGSVLPQALEPVHQLLVQVGGLVIMGLLAVGSTWALLRCLEQQRLLLELTVDPSEASQDADESWPAAVMISAESERALSQTDGYSDQDDQLAETAGMLAQWTAPAEMPDDVVTIAGDVIVDEPRVDQTTEQADAQTDEQTAESLAVALSAMPPEVNQEPEPTLMVVDEVAELPASEIGNESARSPALESDISNELPSYSEAVVPPAASTESTATLSLLSDDGDLPLLVAIDQPPPNEPAVAEEASQDWPSTTDTLLAPDAEPARLDVIAESADWDVDATDQWQAPLAVGEECRRRAFDASVGALYCLDQQGHLGDFNPAYALLFGHHDVADLARMSVEELDALYVEPGRRRVLLDLLSQKQGVTEFESEIQRADGRTAWITETVRAVRDEQDRLEFFAGGAWDITDRKESEGDLQNIHRQMIEAARHDGMSEMANGLLHKLGNVLNSVNVSATLVAEQLRTSKLTELQRASSLFTDHADDLGGFISKDERGKHLPGFITLLTNHLLRERAEMVRELESLSFHIDQVKTIVATQQNYTHEIGTSEAVALVDLLEDAISLNASSLESHGIEVRREYEPVPELLVDKQKIFQILLNLIGNAKDAVLGARDQRPMITVRLKQIDDALCVEVADNGCGISEENLARVFAHGFSTKQDGHGFGLYASITNARELGGTLVAESAGDDRGATFRLEIPLTLAEVVA